MSSLERFMPGGKRHRKRPLEGIEPILSRGYRRHADRLGHWRSRLMIVTAAATAAAAAKQHQNPRSPPVTRTTDPITSTSTAAIRAPSWLGRWCGRPTEQRCPRRRTPCGRTRYEGGPTRGGKERAQCEVNSTRGTLRNGPDNLNLVHLASPTAQQHRVC